MGRLIYRIGRALRSIPWAIAKMRASHKVEDAHSCYSNVHDHVVEKSLTFDWDQCAIDKLTVYYGDRTPIVYEQITWQAFGKNILRKCPNLILIIE